ncbi:MAG: cardiolipin synthase [Clostridia bacterium]|nr:cardiolipin synthase [Clostridia bacterium]
MSLGNYMVWIYILNFIALIIFICFERRDPVVSLAWVLGFTAIPVLGFVIFLIFGTGLKRKTAKKYAEKWHMNMDLSERMSIEDEKKKIKEYGFLPHADLISYLLNTNNSVITDGNNVEILPSAELKFKALIDDIRNAKDSVHLLYFIIRDDEISHEILSLLCEKARSGVKVRFVYDDIGCFFTKRSIFDELKAAGGMVSPFFPMKLGTYSKVNHRNHRKIAVIDGKVGYLGGINIGDEYFGKKKLSPWRDTHIRLTGPAVRYVQKAFSLDWAFSTGEDLSGSIARYFPLCEKQPQNKSVQIACSGPDSKEEEIKCAIIKMINSAKDHIYIETPYFVPDQSFMTALKLAANSGVDVRVIIPGIPDKKYVYYSTESYIGELLNAGVRVYKYNGFLHAKMVVADGDICTIGTTNIDIRSFQLHFEINAFIYDSFTAAECNSLFRDDIHDSVEVTNTQYARRGMWQLMCEGFFRLFSPIM